MNQIDIITQIQTESEKRQSKVDTQREINAEYAELASQKRPTFDVPYTEVDPLR